MPLNILHHKSWNVYNKNNIQRVYRDEAFAKKKKEEEEMRISLTNAERRLKILRERSGLKNLEMIENEVKETQYDKLETYAISKKVIEDTNMHHLFSKNGKKRMKSDDIEMLDKELKKRRESFLNNKHINFWEDFELGKNFVDYRNSEYEKEKLDTDKKWDNTTTMRLNNLEKEPSPWYSHSSLQSSTQRQKDQQSIERDMKIQNNIKDFNDPLTVMRSYLRQKKKIKDHELCKKDVYDLSNFSSIAKKKNENFLEEYKYSSGILYEDYSQPITSEKVNGINDDIKTLREARLSREYEERKKLQLMNNFSRRYTIDYKVVGKYSSQYNPEYVNKHE